MPNFQELSQRIDKKKTSYDFQDINTSEEATTLLTRILTELPLVSIENLAHLIERYPEVCNAFTVIANNHTLTALHLYKNNNLGTRGALILAAALSHPNVLTDLKLSHNGFGVIGINALTHALAKHPTLTTLNLSHNEGTDACVAGITKFILTTTTLQKFLIEENGFSAFQIAHITHVAKNHPSLQTLIQRTPPPLPPRAPLSPRAVPLSPRAVPLGAAPLSPRMLREPRPPVGPLPSPRHRIDSSSTPPLSPHATWARSSQPLLYAAQPSPRAGQLSARSPQPSPRAGQLSARSPQPSPRSPQPSPKFGAEPSPHSPQPSPKFGAEPSPVLARSLSPLRGAAPLGALASIEEEERNNEMAMIDKEGALMIETLQKMRRVTFS